MRLRKRHHNHPNNSHHNHQSSCRCIPSNNYLRTNPRRLRYMNPSNCYTSWNSPRSNSKHSRSRSGPGQAEALQRGLARY